MHYHWHNFWILFFFSVIFKRFIFYFNFYSLISETRSKQVLPSSPQKRWHSHLSHVSLSASHKISDDRYPMQRKASSTQLKPSPHEQKAIEQQPSLPSTGAKKQTPKKTKRLSKEHKTEDSSTDLGSSEISVGEIMALFKPLPACISPLADLVRIQMCFFWKLF